MLVRVYFEMLVINPDLANQILIPVIVATIGGYIFIGFLIFTAKKETIVGEPTFKNPFKLSEALILGLIFGAVIILIKLANNTFGDAGMYVVSFIAGSADVDAVVLSMASFAKTGIPSTTVLNAIVLAIVANSITKFAIVAFVGNRTIALYVGGFLFISLSLFITTYYSVVLP
jgi:uncharacterized membrane protein (DUF4010 family)